LPQKLYLILKISRFKGLKLRKSYTNLTSDVLLISTLAQFHQRSTYSFDARGAQKRKKDSQVISLFMLSGSTSVKAERKYVGEIEP